MSVSRSLHQSTDTTDDRQTDSRPIDERQLRSPDTTGVNDDVTNVAVFARLPRQPLVQPLLVHSPCSHVTSDVIRKQEVNCGSVYGGWHLTFWEKFKSPIPTCSNSTWIPRSFLGSARTNSSERKRPSSGLGVITMTNRHTNKHTYIHAADNIIAVCTYSSAARVTDNYYKCSAEVSNYNMQQ